MLTENELDILNNRKNELNDKIDEKEKIKQELYEQNKEKVELRKQYEKKASIWKTLSVISIIVAIIGLAINIILTIGCVCLFVVFLILRSKPVKAKKELSADLSEYDNKVSAVDEEISTINTELQQINAKIYRHQAEKKYEGYTKDHICVYAGQSTSPGLDGAKPQETANSYSAIEEVTVFIDGVEYGGIDKPFGAFEVSPGPHTVKIECYTRFGSKNGVILRAESKAQQVKVTTGSVFMFYHWNIYNNNGLHHNLFLKTFDNVYDFLVATHQY